MIKAEDNLKLVHFIIQKYFGCKPGSYNYEDLFQEGCYGLTYACKHFNSEYGVSFSTYAIPHISGYIKTYFRKNSLLHISSPLRDLYNKFIVLSGRGYTKEEIIQKLKITIQELEQAIEASQPLSSFDFEIIDESGIALHEIICDKTSIEIDVLDSIEIKEKLKIIKSFVKNRYTQLLALKFKGIKSQYKIGKILNLSQCEISREIKDLKTKIFPLVNQFYDGKITEQEFIKALGKYRRNDSV